MAPIIKYLATESSGNVFIKYFLFLLPDSNPIKFNPILLQTAYI